MNRKYIRVSAVAVLLAAAVAANSEQPKLSSIETPRDLLFIGNSFTYYNNGLQNHLSRLASSGGVETGRYRIYTLSGSRLEEHAAALPTIAAARDWDAIVLQGHSREAMDDDRVAGFHAAASAHDEVIDQSGAQTVMFMTWAYEGEPQQTSIISDNYTKAGNAADALVVPVGEVFAAVTKSHPEISLRIPDGRHPTLAGSYLAACTFYAAFFGQSPEGLDYTAGLDADVATVLQAAAWQVTREYYGGAR